MWRLALGTVLISISLGNGITKSIMTVVGVLLISYFVNNEMKED